MRSLCSWDLVFYSILLDAGKVACRWFEGVCKVKRMGAKTDDNKSITRLQLYIDIVEHI